jgi:hypothetical protein
MERGLNEERRLLSRLLVGELSVTCQFSLVNSFTSFLSGELFLLRTDRLEKLILLFKLAREPWERMDFLGDPNGDFLGDPDMDFLGDPGVEGGKGKRYHGRLCSLASVSVSQWAAQYILHVGGVEKALVRIIHGGF